MIKLIDIYSADKYQQHEYCRELYVLLGEREQFESISHKKMPSWQEHLNFIYSRPYLNWSAIINDNDQFVGSCYITHKFEIGVGVLLWHRKKGYAEAALNKIIGLYPNVMLLANINPMNPKSVNLFNKLGFKLVQNTYAKEPT